MSVIERMTSKREAKNENENKWNQPTNQHLECQSRCIRKQPWDPRHYALGQHLVLNEPFEVAVRFACELIVRADLHHLRSTPPSFHAFVKRRGSGTRVTRERGYVLRLPFNLLMIEDALDSTRASFEVKSRAWRGSMA